MFQKCEVSMILAYFSLIYIIASAYYLIITRSYGTPFRDAIQKYPELAKIKANSADKRRKAFYCGIAIAIGIVWYFKPFKSCSLD